ncbi:MAG: Ldh family oxidoreductase [Rhodospirillales bacterium]|nr:Ldh family oxidoreductase [Rhodospirillales bacterium]
MDTRPVPAERLGAQLGAILRAWGMPEPQIADTVEIMLWADLAGIDSHGAAMMPLYAQFRDEGKIVLAPEIRIVRESPTTAVIDGGFGLGHVPGKRAMLLAIAKAKMVGIGAVAVRASNHYGAAGAYAMMAAEEGLIGISTTAVHTPSVVPLWGADPAFGTNPIAFAAPARRNKPFLLDMATSTAAIGKLKLAQLAGRKVPEGWAVDAAGRPVTDPETALRDRRLVALGGTRELGGHKGYGLAMMVEILSSTLPGAQFALLRMARDPGAKHADVGHFFLAMDPAAFRPAGEFEAELDEMIDALRATRPADPERPVLVPGDPEHQERARRLADGIPIPEKLRQALNDIARRSSAEAML